MKPASLEKWSSYLTALSGGISGTAQKEQLAQAAWLFTYSSLFNNQILSIREKDNCIKIISRYLSSKNPKRSFLNFCQRITLARLNVTSLKAGSLSLPSTWLLEANTDGYAITKDFLDPIKLIRLSLPRHRTELKGLAEAVLEFSEEPTQQNFRYWRNYFIEKDEPILLNLFITYASNRAFNI